MAMTRLTDAPGTDTGDIARRLEQTGAGPLQLTAVLVIGLGSMFEILELAMTGVFGTVFAADVHSGAMRQWQLGLLLASTSIGAALGSPLFGFVADRFGRRTSLTLALMLAAIFSLACVLSRSHESLLATRLIASFGIGSYLPVSAAYLADIIPSRMRGRAMMLNLIIAGFGGLVCGSLTSWFTVVAPFGIAAWRGTMIVAATGTLLCAIAIRFLPESPIWLDAAGHRDQALRQLTRLERSATRGRRPAASVLRDISISPDISEERLWDRRYRGRIGLVSSLQFANPWCTSSFAAFIGWVFAARGYKLADAVFLQGLLTTGASFGALVSMSFIDRVSRPVLMTFAGVLIAIAAMIFTGTRAPSIALIASFTITMAAGVQSWVLTLFSAELFPPHLRAKATTLAYAVNRISSIAVPLVILPVLLRVGEVGMFSVMACVMLLSSLIVWLGRHFAAPMRGSQAASVATGFQSDPAQL